MTDDKLLIIDNEAIEKIKESLVKASPYGSVEIFIQDNRITQITYRHIEKTDYRIRETIHRNTLDVDKAGHIIERG